MPADRKHSHYFKPCPYEHVDVYRVLHMFSITDQTIGHALKKLLVAGGRGAGKDIHKDVQEAIDSLVRWQEMRAEEAAPPVRMPAPGEEWHLWAGDRRGTPPEGLSPDHFVSVRLRSGRLLSARVCVLHWMHRESPEDILAWRRGELSLEERMVA
jgi:hypothetical protein